MFQPELEAMSKVAKATVNLGTKHECNCGTKFYDLGKPEPVCPKCGTNPLQDSKSAREEAPAKVEKAKVKKDESPPKEESEVEDDDLEEDEDLDDDLDLDLDEDDDEDEEDEDED
jgi:hypothetical protein